MNDRNIVPDYEWIINTYQIRTLMKPGDLSVVNGDFALTKDGDLKLGDDFYSGLFRFVQAWRFHYPHLRQLFSLAQEIASRRATLEEQCEKALLEAQNKFSASPGNERFDKYHELNDQIDASEIGHKIYSSCLILLIDATLRRLKDDVGAKQSAWANCKPDFNGIPLGELVKASANSFRHADEWAKSAVPTLKQKPSQTALNMAMRNTLDDWQQGTNDCSIVLSALSDGWRFEALEAAVIGFANDLVEQVRDPKRNG